MRHQDAQELLSAFLDGELQEKRKQEVEEHLRSCEACREEILLLEQLDQVSKTMPAADRTEDYWEAFPRRIADGIRRQSPGRPVTARGKEAAMFKDSFIVPPKNIGLKAIVFPFSLAAHALVILLFVIFPLLNTGSLPQVEIYSAFLAPPPAASSPAPPAR